MLSTGEVLNGRYRVEQVLGQGGMGNVYLATHLELQGRVAIKEMKIGLTDPADRDAALRQFRNEAQILHRLRHPNLPRVHDFLESGGCHYLVMDFIAGMTLRQVLDQQGSQPEKRVLEWVRELCDVLEFLHGHEPPVVFRDLKPSNIMLNDAGRIQLIDFGLARIFQTRRTTIEPGAARTGAPSTQSVMTGSGSPGYAAPEQYGATSDARTDIYALGATIYTLLTGQSPPPSVDVVSGLASRPPVRRLDPDVSEQTEQAVEAMMNVNRDLRPQSIGEIRVLLGIGDSTRNEDAWRTTDTCAPSLLARRRTRPVMVTALLLLAATIPGLLWARSDRRASLMVASTPPGATIYVGDRRQEGLTPLTIQGLAPGTCEIRVERSGSRSYTRSLRLVAGTNQAQVALSPEGTPSATAAAPEAAPGVAPAPSVAAPAPAPTPPGQAVPDTRTPPAPTYGAPATPSTASGPSLGQGILGSDAPTAVASIGERPESRPDEIGTGVIHKFTGKRLLLLEQNGRIVGVGQIGPSSYGATIGGIGEGATLQEVVAAFGSSYRPAPLLHYAGGKWLAWPERGVAVQIVGGRVLSLMAAEPGFLSR